MNFFEGKAFLLSFRIRPYRRVSVSNTWSWVGSSRGVFFYFAFNCSYSTGRVLCITAPTKRASRRPDLLHDFWKCLWIKKKRVSSAHGSLLLSWELWTAPNPCSDYRRMHECRFRLRHPSRDSQSVTIIATRCCWYRSVTSANFIHGDFIISETENMRSGKATMDSDRAQKPSWLH